MENEIVLYVEGMRGHACEKKIVNEIAMLPGIELVQVDYKKGAVQVTGGDVDRLAVEDIVESLGYPTIH